MSEQTRATVAHHDPSRGTLASYVTGYIFSVYLTVTAYLLVYNHLLRHTLLTIVIVGLALIQFLVQMVFFLHLGRETKPRWKLVVMLFMITIVLILVIGSLWIMSNLNYRMTPEQMNTYMQNQQGL